MPIKNSPEERKIMSFLEDAGGNDGQFGEQISEIRNNGLTEEIVAALREALAKGDTNAEDPQTLKLVSQFNMLVNRWRLAAQMKNFRRR